MSLRNQLLTAIKGIESPGSFAYFGSIKPFVDPEIYVQGVGSIDLPLDPFQAERLIEKAHQAPYGLGNETIVDTSVRNTWELNPGEDFEFRNPQWRAYVKQCCDSAAMELGVHSPVSAQLYKMLIYQKGAMFQPHTDTEKVPGMFATLVICLPSPHRGGALSVCHNGEQMTFHTSKSQKSFACWYSDVEHEILKVTSGYRWVLTYNLVLDTSIPRPRVDSRMENAWNAQQILHRTIERWLMKDKHSREMDHAYYKLDYQYTQANISLNALKNHDLARVQALQDIAMDLPIEIYLGLLEKEESGSCDLEFDPMGNIIRSSSRKTFHPLYDVALRNIKALGLFELDGLPAEEDAIFDTRFFLQRDIFNFTPQEKYTKYMGNWGPEATHWYRVAAVIIVPSDSIAFFDPPRAQDGDDGSVQNGLVDTDSRKRKREVIDLTGDD